MSTSAAHETDPAAAALHALAVALGTISPPCWTRDPDLWFSTDTAPAAIALCARCHAADACLSYGRDIGARHGIWGGVNLHVDRHGTRNRTAPRPLETGKDTA